MAGESLGGVPTRRHEVRLFRIATLLESLEDFAARAELNQQETQDLRAFTGAADPLDELLDAPFKIGRFGRPSRFSDGKFPVFYSAESADTSVLEKLSSLERNHPGGEIVQWMFSCEFNGNVKDLTPHLSERGYLIAESHDACQLLGREAIEAELDGLRSPSARDQPNGVCVPVFRRKPLSGAILKQRYKFKVAAGVVTCSPD